MNFARQRNQRMRILKGSPAAAALLVLIAGVSPSLADEPAPPVNLVATDHPNDVGNAVDLSWTLSPDDTADADPRRVVRYQILRKMADAEEFEPIGEATYQSNSFIDRNTAPDQSYLYQIVAVGPDDDRSDAVTTAAPISPTMQWFDRSRAWFGIILLFVCGAIIFFVAAAKRGWALKIRRIPGLEAVTDAVGRATEMGRPCLFVPGIQDINDIQTIAGITVLSRVAQIAAEYDARIEVPTARSLVMTTARETVAAAYLGAGRPDAFREDDIYYVTDEQFGYVASVAGTIVREKPAACFYMGSFYAESLILAETGNSIGAIQVAGTGQPSQLPFFVAACDFTLIGEEFLAASAYLSGEPQQLGSLKGQDVGKLLGAGLIVGGCLLATLLMFTDLPQAAAALAYVRDNILGDKGLLP